MKDFLKATLVMSGLLALALGVRVATFTHFQNEAAATQSAAVIATADTRCGAMDVKMPCFRNAARSAPVQPAEAATIVTQDTHCAARSIKMPCFQHSDKDKRG